MSVDPNMIAQMLMSQGAGGTGAVGGMQPQTNGVQAGADLMRKIMMIQALKNQQAPQPGQQPTLPGSPNGMTQGGLNANPSIPGQMVPQQMLQQQMPGGTDA